MAERKRRGEDAADDDRLEEAYDDADLDDELEIDDELDDDDDLDEDDTEPVAAGSRSARGRESGARAGRGSTSTRDKAGKRSGRSGDKRPAKKGESRANVFARVVTFFREIVAELRKVIWPTRSELLTYTAVVVVFVTVMLAIVGGLDWVFTQLAVLIFGNGTAAG